MAVVIPAECPKLVRTRCVIEGFCGVFVLSCCSFVIGLSQISSFFSYPVYAAYLGMLKLSIIGARRLASKQLLVHGYVKTTRNCHSVSSVVAAVVS